MIRAFFGPAGSGKTWKLVDEAQQWVNLSPLAKHQSILALTFMHGSRRRLFAKLAGFQKAGTHLTCDTIDSFCLRLVNRFRSYIGKSLPISVAPHSDSSGWTRSSRTWIASLPILRKTAAQLLDHDSVNGVCASSYPLVIVDECQDCSAEMLEVLERLARRSHVLVAADQFQRLHRDDDTSACDWLQQNAECDELSGNHRTSAIPLINTALALRSNEPAERCVRVHAPDAPGITAWTVSVKLAWGGLDSGSTRVIISPARPHSSQWVREIGDSLSNSLGKRPVGPYPFDWEKTEDEQHKTAVAAFECEEGTPITVDALKRHKQAGHYIVRQAVKRALHLVSIRGESAIDWSEMMDIVSKCTHLSVAFGPERPLRRRAMTIHGAKNREFDYVFILWPFEVSSDQVYRRKLLYNAITRARKEAILFVQGGEQRVIEDDVLCLLRSGIDNNAKPWK